MSGTTATQEPTTDTTQPPATTGHAPGNQSGEPAGSGKTFTQAELDAIVADRLNRERKKAEEAQAKAQRDADEAKLKEQNEYKTLAEKHAERITALESEVEASKSVAEERDRAVGAVKAILEEQRKDLPDYVIELLDTRDPVSQLDWLAKNRAAIVGTNGRTGGPPATPRSNGHLTREQAREEAKNKYLEQAGVRTR